MQSSKQLLERWTLTPWIFQAIGLCLRPRCRKAFLLPRRKHIGFVVDYTVGIATKDKAKQDKAVADLIKYSEDFGAFLSSANPNLPKNAVAELVKGHVVTLKDVVDAQAAARNGRWFTATCGRRRVIWR